MCPDNTSRDHSLSLGQAHHEGTYCYTRVALHSLSSMPALSVLQSQTWRTTHIATASTGGVLCVKEVVFYNIRNRKIGNGSRSRGRARAPADLWVCTCLYRQPQPALKLSRSNDPLPDPFINGKHTTSLSLQWSSKTNSDYAQFLSHDNRTRLEY